MHETKRVRPALARSYEALFHEAGIPVFIATFAGDDQLSAEFRTERLERAIGVIYRPETERLSHYFFARLADQFDPVLHFDETRPVQPPPHPAHAQPPAPPATAPASRQH